MLRIVGYSAIGLFLLLGAGLAIVVIDPFHPADILAMRSLRHEIQMQGDLTPQQSRDYYDRSLKVADDHPHTVGGLTMLLIAATRLTDEDANGAAKNRLGKALEEEDLNLVADALVRHLGNTDRLADLVPKLAERLKADPDHPRAAELTAWICAIAFPKEHENPSEIFIAAADQIRDRYAASPAISPFCDSLKSALWISQQWPRRFEDHLAAIIKVNKDRYVLCSASFAQAQIVLNYGEERQEEAEKLFAAFCDKFGGKTDHPLADLEQPLIHDARIQLKELRYRALGKPAPALAGLDLNGKHVKLADFKGNATLVCFWGTWCHPCMKLVPHERELAQRFASRKFALIGVNCDDELEDAKAAAQKHGMTWPVIQNESPSGEKITAEWKILGFPTLYLIDHHGVIRRRWVGAPSLKLLDAAAELFVTAADKNVPPEGMKAVTDQFAAMIRDASPSIEPANRDAATPRDPVAQIERDARFKLFDDAEGGGKYVVYAPAQRPAHEKLPAILFLHGNGAQGTDGKRQLYQGLAPAILEMKDDFPFIAIFPQALEGEDWLATGGGKRALRILERVLDRAQTEYPIDPDRIILSGFSMGGEGAWSLGASEAPRWAAIVPISHGWRPDRAEMLKSLPCWAFHSDADELISASGSREMIAALQSAGAHPLYTEYPALTHAQTPRRAFLGPELLSWLLLQRRQPK